MLNITAALLRMEYKVGKRDNRGTFWEAVVLIEIRGVGTGQGNGKGSVEMW